MIKVVYYDLSKPTHNLIRVVSNGNLELGRLELDVQEGDDLEQKVREKLEAENAN